MVYGELERYPLLIAAKMRILPFWARLNTSQESKISCMLYKLLYKMHVSSFYHNEWLIYIKKNFMRVWFPIILGSTKHNGEFNLTCG